MKRLCCKDYCPLWYSVDKYCDFYGERHPRLRECHIFKLLHTEELERLLNEIEREKNEKIYI